MKFLMTIVFFLIITTPCFAQYGSDHVNPFGAMPFIGMPQTASSANGNSQSAIIAATGGYAVDMSLSRINDQTAYSMMLDNHTKKIDTYFNGRSSNAYYRDMEEWRKKEKAYLKRSGIWNRETINYIYGR
jgi:hypothetical protein